MYTKACVNKHPTNLNVVFYTSQRTCTYKFSFDALDVVRTFILHKRKFNLCATEQLTQGYTVKLTGAAAAKLLQSCPTLCDPIDSNTPGSPVPGILQARTLEWVPLPSLQFRISGKRSVCLLPFDPFTQGLFVF